MLVHIQMQIGLDILMIDDQLLVSVFLLGYPISRKSKKQNAVARSNAEA